MSVYILTVLLRWGMCLCSLPKSIKPSALQAPRRTVKAVPQVFHSVVLSARVSASFPTLLLNAAIVLQYDAKHRTRGAATAQAPRHSSTFQKAGLRVSTRSIVRAQVVLQCCSSLPRRSCSARGTLESGQCRHDGKELPCLIRCSQLDTKQSFVLHS